MFLFRPELIHFFNYKIFLDVTFENTLSRNIKRELKQKIGSVEDMIDRYNARYMPGQKLYLYEAKPKQKSDIIIDNNDFENPIISK
jgi:uridine kinase